jgi:hypothetical protein
LVIGTIRNVQTAHLQAHLGGDRQTVSVDARRSRAQAAALQHDQRVSALYAVGSDPKLVELATQRDEARHRGGTEILSADAAAADPLLVRPSTNRTSVAPNGLAGSRPNARKRNKIG